MQLPLSRDYCAPHRFSKKSRIKTYLDISYNINNSYASISNVCMMTNAQKLGCRHREALPNDKHEQTIDYSFGDMVFNSC